MCAYYVWEFEGMEGGGCICVCVWGGCRPLSVCVWVKSI